ncbi:MAG: arsenic efflux protein [Methylothermaceae bacterium]|nr:arsenic efflux protein [Methylothermaceae bacterium]
MSTENTVDILKHTLLITGFVFTMMLAIEYLNVLTRGAWQKRLAGHRLGQYVLAALLGMLPGCLGAFAVVSLYTHRVVTVGALVAAMIATAGDESFVMFALIPEQALYLHLILFAIGLTAGMLTDAALQVTHTSVPCPEGFAVHEEEEPCRCFPYKEFWHQWKRCSPARGALTLLLVGFLAGVLQGALGPQQWNWIRISLLASSMFALFVVATVPDHFLETHLWEHAVRKHLPRVFVWTLAALILMHVLIDRLNLGDSIEGSRWIMLLIACLLGLIPESGPHLVFVTLFAEGVLPFGILLASSIVQDGHGMLPLLAHSRRSFFGVKAVNFIVGLIAGAVCLLWEDM